jgi:hypothetical protein
MAGAEWQSFAERLLPVLGRPVVDQIDSRRRRRVPALLRLWDTVERTLSSLLSPIPRRRRAMRC